jgi:hypothetical protein
VFVVEVRPEPETGFSFAVVPLTWGVTGTLAVSAVTACAVVSELAVALAATVVVDVVAAGVGDAGKDVAGSAGIGGFVGEYFATGVAVTVVTGV